jgi:hypothetical protein
MILPILPKEIISKILLYNIHPIAEILKNIYIEEYGTKYLELFSDHQDFLEIFYPSYFYYYIGNRAPVKYEDGSP